VGLIFFSIATMLAKAKEDVQKSVVNTNQLSSYGHTLARFRVYQQLWLGNYFRLEQAEPSKE